MYVKDLWIRFYASSLFLYTFESVGLRCKLYVVRHFKIALLKVMV